MHTYQKKPYLLESLSKFSKHSIFFSSAKIHTKKLLYILVLSAPFTASASDRPEVGRYVQAYTGEEHVSVYTVRLGAPENAEALIMVSGIDNKLDGVIQKASVMNDGNNRRSYHIKSADGEYELLRLDRDSGRLFVGWNPTTLSEYRVSYNREESEHANGEHLLTRWLEHK